MYYIIGIFSIHSIHMFVYSNSHILFDNEMDFNFPFPNANVSVHIPLKVVIKLIRVDSVYHHHPSTILISVAYNSIFIC